MQDKLVKDLNHAEQPEDAMSPKTHEKKGRRRPTLQRASNWNGTHATYSYK